MNLLNLIDICPEYPGFLPDGGEAWKAWDWHEYIDALVNALTDISRRFYDPSITYEDHHYTTSFPKLSMRPRSAFHEDSHKDYDQDWES